MIVGSVFRLIKQARYIKSVIKKNQKVLVPGKYQLLDNFRSVCLMNPDVLAKAELFLPKGCPSRVQNHMVGILNKYGFASVRVRNNQGEYEALYIANNYDKAREVKLFSFRKKKILTICTNSDEVTKQLKQYSSLSDAYSLPCVVRSEQYENALDVSMVERLEFPGNEQALTKIAAATVNHNQKVNMLRHEPVKTLISFSYEDATINTCLTNLSREIHKEIIDLKLPLCLQHGDLSKDNLIYGEADGEKDFWWIDWEHAKERVFFYDYFFYIINSAFYEDTGAFDCYITGRNDTVLKDYFSHMGLVFDPNKKWDYFLVFAIVFMKERICDLGNVYALTQYYQLIEKLKATSDGAIL